MSWEGGAGAGEGNRTLVVSLGSCCSTIELHPHFNHLSSTYLHFLQCILQLSDWNASLTCSDNSVNGFRSFHDLSLRRSYCPAVGGMLTVYFGAPQAQSGIGTQHNWSVLLVTLVQQLCGGLQLYAFSSALRVDQSHGRSHTVMLSDER